MFRVVKVIERVPQAVYKPSDLQERPVEDLFYNYELVKIAISPETWFQIDKIVRTRNKGRIKQHLVKWKGYDDTFKSWANVTDIKEIYWIILRNNGFRHSKLLFSGQHNSRH